MNACMPLSLPAAIATKSASLSVSVTSAFAAFPDDTVPFLQSTTHSDAGFERLNWKTPFAFFAIDGSALRPAAMPSKMAADMAACERPRERPTQRRRRHSEPSA
jgi:hypothetical protein